MGSHINTFFKGNPYSMDHLFSETCVLSLASSQTGEQLRSKKLYESSPHCMLWHWRSPQDEMQFQGKQKEIGNCTWEVSAGSQSISFGLSLSTNQLTSKRSHGTWQPCRSFIASLQSITALLPLRKHSKLMMGYVLENRPEDSFFYWHVLPAAG